MPTTTSNQGFPLPVAGDDPNVPDDLNTLALAIERRVVGVYNSTSDRSTRVPAPQEGQVAYLKDSNTFTYYTGSAWAEMFPAQVSITSGTANPTGGSNGDVYFKV